MRRRSVLAALLIAVAIVVAWVHAPVLSARALWHDDEQYMVENGLVRSPSWASASRFLTEVQRPSTVEGYYQPLAMISLMLDCAAGGRPDHLRPFHRTSLALHVLNTMLIIVLLVLLFGNPYAAAMVGLLFGVHPLTVEAMPWVSERKTLLAAFFALAALIAYVQYARTAALDEGKSGRVWYAASLTCYALALLSKPTSTPLPALFLLLDYWPLRRLDRRAVLEKVPFFLLGGIAAAVTVLSQGNAAGVLYPGEQSPWRILLIICHNVVFYLWKIVWPVPLSAHYEFPDPLSLSNPMVLAGVIGTGVLIPLLVVSLRKTRALLTGWLFFFVAIFPTLGVIGFTTVIASDKYLYLPSFGLMMILAWALGQCWSRGSGRSRRALQLTICVVVVGLAAVEARATRRYLSVWQNTVTLYEHVLAQYPKAWLLHYFFGDFLADEGRLPEAADRYREALALKPDDADAHHKLGNVLFSLGRIDDAAGHYRQAIALRPDDVDAHHNLANILFSQGRMDEAVVYYSKAMRLRPYDVDLIYNQAVAFADLGRSDEAVALFHKALRLNPDHVQANHELGAALAKQGDQEEAVAYFRKAVELKPDFVEAPVNLADTLQVIGRSEEAGTHYRLALQLNRNDPAVHNNLAVALSAR